ncbi:low molecular weight protein-tyrosine-phosphatase [Cyanobium sp. ATX 6F1]|uniref:low molecular weight protein-tyrosine-phosphatase n=1 Tax=unclassified Cyanobium TaxID=2627006 RepID=UPI0020CC6368|nr:low molecular weight protein-tyrosine-phosphatase [Cyanobium sp. ATX 6F1]MCP9917222.1 low molecular weight phosphotyrosine protein phosphatase [Cyanobium sp. ATX 6F1]
MTQRILFVCLGNICRSPAAEGIFLHLLDLTEFKSNYLVDSAGTGAWHVGNDADKRMRAAAAKRGVNLLSKARQITEDDLMNFDRILTMDQENFKQVCRMAAQSGIDQDKIALIEPITNHCCKFSATMIPDPYYGDDNGFEDVLDLLEDACAGLLARLNERSHS